MRVRPATNVGGDACDQMGNHCARKQAACCADDWADPLASATWARGHTSLFSAGVRNFVEGFSLRAIRLTRS